MLPIELQQIFEEYDDSDYWLVLRRASWEEKLVVEFSLEVQNINDKGEIKQDWTVEAINPLRCDFSFDWTTTIKVSTSEPLLWEFTDTQCELYVSGELSSPDKLFYEISNVHKAVFGNLIVFNMPSFDARFLSLGAGLSSGLLTTGPKRLLQRYAVCVAQAGLVPNLIEIPNLPEDDKDTAHTGLKAFILGESFIVASDFMFRQSNMATES